MNAAAGRRPEGVAIAAGQASEPETNAAAGDRDKEGTGKLSLPSVSEHFPLPLANAIQFQTRFTN